MNHQTITLKIHNDDVIRLAKSKFAFIVARHMSKYNNAADKLVENFDKIEYLYGRDEVGLICIVGD